MSFTIMQHDGMKVIQYFFNMLLQIPDIINQSGSQGEFELDIFKVIIKQMNRYENNHIKVTK